MEEWSRVIDGWNFGWNWFDYTLLGLFILCVCGWLYERLPSAKKKLRHWRVLFDVRHLQVYAVCIVLFTSWEWYILSRTYVDIEYPNKAFYYRGGFFQQDKFRLHKKFNFWLYSDNGQIKALRTPIDGPFNDSRIVRFDFDGKVYSVNKKDYSDRAELRVVNGEWSMGEGNDWYSLEQYSDDVNFDAREDDEVPFF